MSKITELKNKVQGKLADVKKKIPFLNKKASAKGSDAPQATASNSPEITEGSASKEPGLKQIYKEGRYGTKTLIFTIFVFIFVGLASSIYLGIRVYRIIKSAKFSDSAQKDYSTQFGNLSQKAAEAASIVSLGTVTVNTSDGHKIFTVDIWLKSDSPHTARIIQNIDVRLRDTAIGILREVTSEKTNILSDTGKYKAKIALIKALNAELKGGKIIEIYFYNLMLE